MTTIATMNAAADRLEHAAAVWAVAKICKEGEAEAARLLRVAAMDYAKEMRKPFALVDREAREA